jgi:hypothetical protein
MAINSCVASGLQEVLHRGWHFVELRKASAQLVGDILGHVARPALGGVEGDDANWMPVLIPHQVADQRGKAVQAKGPACQGCGVLRA